MSMHCAHRIHRRRTPRKRGIQYAAASRFHHERSGILDHPPSRVTTTAYAARTDPRKLSTSSFSRSDCDDRPFAASSSFEAELPSSPEALATPTMLSLTSRVPFAACCTLPEISRVAVPCCPTACAMALEIWLISAMVPPIAWIALTASPVAV